MAFQFGKDLQNAIEELDPRKVREALYTMQKSGFGIRDLDFSPYSFAINVKLQKRSQEILLGLIIKYLLEFDDGKKGRRVVDEPSEVTFLHQVLGVEFPTVRLDLIELLVTFGVRPQEEDFVFALKSGQVREFEAMLQYGFNIQIAPREGKEEFLPFLQLYTQISYSMDFIAKIPFFMAKAEFFNAPLNEFTDLCDKVKEKYITLKQEERDLYLEVRKSAEPGSVPHPCVNLVESTRKRKRDYDLEALPCTQRIKTELIPMYENYCEKAKQDLDNVIASRADSFRFFECRESVEFFQDQLADLKAMLSRRRKLQDSQDQALLAVLAGSAQRVVSGPIRDVLASATQCLVSGKGSDFDANVWRDVARFVELIKDPLAVEETSRLQQSLAARLPSV